MKYVRAALFARAIYIQQDSEDRKKGAYVIGSTRILFWQHLFVIGCYCAASITELPLCAKESGEERSAFAKKNTVESWRRVSFAKIFCLSGS